METMTIGQLAERAGVNVESIRFYERKGMIPQPPRRSSGFRQYPEEMVRYIRFIKHAQELGFSLKEIKELLDLQVGTGGTCREVRERAKIRLAEVEGKIVSLQRMKQELAGLIASCSGDGSTSSCPILNAIDHMDECEWAGSDGSL